jgi:membrane peptidoglycan carboxypeptidase
MGNISQEQADEAKKIDTLAKVVKNKSQYKDIKAPHFVLEVYDQLKEQYGKDLTKLGFTVTTTLDVGLQADAEAAIAQGIAAVDRGGFNNAAIVSEDVETGQVVAMVGSRDFTYPGYGEKNIATSPRSPGSSFKPYDYAALMSASENWGAGSIFYDLKTDFGGNYRPENYDGREPGGISMRYALGGSRNIPAIKAMYAAGINYTHEVVKKLGVTDGITGCAGAPDCADILSTALGDGGQVRLDQHVHGYATLSRLGKNIPQTYVLKIENAKGKVIEEWKESEGEQGVDPQIAYIINDMLSDKNASYFRLDRGFTNRITNGFEGMDIPATMKTGTTNNFDNGWLMGSSTKYATGVWIGHHENKSATTRGFENLTAPIWGEFMRRAHEKLPAKPVAWVNPEGIKTVDHDSAYFALIKSKCTGAQLGNVCGYGQSDIYPSWYSPKKSGAGQKAIIDTVSNRLATECTPERAKKEITSGNIQPEIPSSDPNYTRWLSPIQARYGGVAGGAIPVEKDNVHNCGDTKPTASISGPSACDSYCEYTVSYTSGTHSVKTLNMKVNGQIVTSYDISPGGGAQTFSYVPTFGGSGTLVAEVVDSALYDGTDTKTVIFGQPPTLTLLGTTNQGGDYKLSWSPTVNNAGCFEILRNDSVFIPCDSGNDYVVNGPVPAGTKFVVKAKSTSGVEISRSNEVTKN